MYKFPLRVPKGMSLTLAQPFHTAAPADLSRALSIQPVDHLGVDITCGTPEQTWGTECIWPFPWPGVVYDSQVDSLFGATQHAHAQIDTTDPATGIQYSVIYLHLSSVTKTKAATDSTVVVYNYGDVIGKIGNNGAVYPPPTPGAPYAGSHLHLGLAVKLSANDLNFTMVDPLLYLDLADPFVSSDTPFTFTRQMGYGMSGQDIQVLQARLGMPPNLQTGYFGLVTKGYVMWYQIRKNIAPVSGYVGQKTLASLNA